MLYIWDYHNIVNQLYLNFKKESWAGVVSEGYRHFTQVILRTTHGQMLEERDSLLAGVVEGGGRLEQRIVEHWAQIRGDSTAICQEMRLKEQQSETALGFSSC